MKKPLLLWLLLLCTVLLLGCGSKSVTVSVPDRAVIVTEAPAETTVETTVPESSEETTVPGTSAEIEPETTAETEPEETSAPVQTYVLNTNSKKFHYPECSSVKQMKEKNKKIFNGTREEVIAMGYDPCGNCHP